MSEKLKEIERLRDLAMMLPLENRSVLYPYSNYELSQIYNGIGSDDFPEWLRNVISAIHPSLAVVALIHDVEWHESDKSKDGFKRSNDRFKRNGYIVAKSLYGWYNPRRYIVMNQARRFGNICQTFGWKTWVSSCECPAKRGGSLVDNRMCGRTSASFSKSRNGGVSDSMSSGRKNGE